MSDLKSRVLFKRGDGGYALFRIPAMVTTKKGTILVACEARMTRSDWSCKSIVIRRSEDKGESWGPLESLVSIPKDATGNYEDNVLNNPLFIVDKQNIIHFLYCGSYTRAFHCTSTDDGKTFSNPKEITRTFKVFRDRDGVNWNVIATGPGSGIQLENGRLIAPIWVGYGKGKSHRPNTCGTIFSDDSGKTWQAGDILSPKFYDDFGNLNENEPVELADGTVMINIRCHSNDHRRAYSLSDDGAHNWSEPRLIEDLFEPICMGSADRLTVKGRDGFKKNRILFSNPSSDRIFTIHKRQRANLTIKMSYDEGKTWPVVRRLQKGKAGYSDLAVSPDSQKNIYCLYERARSGFFWPPKTYFDEICFAKFDLEWLTKGKDAFSS